MQRRRVWRSVWQPCWQWPLWCRQQMQRCQRFRTSNRLTSIWEHASLWSLPVYWVNKQLSIPLKTDSKPPTIHWAKIQPVAKRFSPYISLSLSLTHQNTHTHTHRRVSMNLHTFSLDDSISLYWKINKNIQIRKKRFVSLQFLFILIFIIFFLLFLLLLLLFVGVVVVVGVSCCLRIVLVVR